MDVINLFRESVEVICVYFEGLVVGLWLVMVVCGCFCFFICFL